MRYYTDSEFNGWHGDVLSMAVVAEDDRALYLISDSFHEDNPDIQPWVRANVLPYRLSCPIEPVVLPPAQWGPHIRDFLIQDVEPYVLADWPSDIAHFCNAMIVGDGMRIKTAHQVRFNLIAIDSWPNEIEGAVRHNPYWDAYALRQRIREDEAAL